MLNSIFTTTTSQTITLTAQGLALATAVSLVLGVLGALIYMFRNTYSKGFVVTLALMPSIVQLVIMLVNGNLGAGVAVMGAFSLVRFRSVPGGAREITAIFLAMAIGLATGMGYLAVAAIFLVVIGGVSILLAVSRFGEDRSALRQLKVTMPEDLDYTDIFDDLFAKYTRKCEFIRVRTTNLGSLFELTYHIQFTDVKKEKEFIDALRCRNGNLPIVWGRVPANKDEL